MNWNHGKPDFAFWRGCRPKHSGSQPEWGGYLGLDPRVRQSGDAPANHGHISKQGSNSARHALVEACWVDRPPTRPDRRLPSTHQSQARPLDRDRRVGAQARLPVLLSAHARRGLRLRAAVADHQEDAPPLAAGAPHRQGGRDVWSTNKAMRHAERALVLQAQRAYERTVADWQNTKWVRARHRGAHHKGRPAAQQRGRPQSPNDLRSSSSSPAPAQTVAKRIALDHNDLTFIRRAKEQPGVAIRQGRCRARTRPSPSGGMDRTVTRAARLRGA